MKIVRLETAKTKHIKKEDIEDRVLQLLEAVDEMSAKIEEQDRTIKKLVRILTNLHR
jgi:hypothetical protein